MSIPNLSDLAAAVFTSYPEDVKTLNTFCDQTEADRAAFGEDDPRVQAGEGRVNNLKGLFTRRIAWACFQQDPRFGLRKKTTGAIAIRPSDGLTHSTDALMMSNDGQIIDVMSDRHWSWGVNPGDTQPVDQWVKPLPPEGEPVPAPTPVPVPDPTPAPVPLPVPVPVPPVDLTPILKALVALGQQVDTLQGQIQELASKPDPVVKVPPVTFPKYSGSIFGVRITLTPEK